jgi:hypothetical protein
MQTFPGGAYRARHETLLSEATSDRRAAEVRRSPRRNRVWTHFTFATNLFRSVVNLLRHVRPSRVHRPVGTVSVRGLSRVDRG